MSYLLPMKQDILPEVAALRDIDVWGEHPDHLRDDWINDVAERNTNLGYWEWVSSQIESSRGE